MVTESILGMVQCWMLCIDTTNVMMLLLLENETKSSSIGYMHHPTLVMEVGGVTDHSIETTDGVFVAYLSCKSRPANHKSRLQAGKECKDNLTRESPVLWVRLDPEKECCDDCTLKQSEDA